VELMTDQKGSIARAAFHLRLSPTLNNQQAGVNWADDFDFAAKLFRLKGP
jgi:hypothetical protein